MVKFCLYLGGSYEKNNKINPCTYIDLHNFSKLSSRYQSWRWLNGLGRYYMIFSFLFIFWIILNGSITYEIILIGTVLSAFVTVFSYKNIRVSRELEKKVVKNLGKIIKYLTILLVEVIKANIDIIKLVLSKNPEISPTLKPMKAKLKSRISRVALANSITLTPGTITVSMNQDDLLIHAIEKSNLDGIEESIFVEKLQEMEED